MKLPAVRSIRQKLNFILLATTLAALLIAGIALVLFDLRSELRSIENDLVTQADIMGLVNGPALSFDDPRVAAENLRVLRLKPNLAAAALYGAKGKLFASYVDTAAEGVAVPSVAGTPGVSFDSQWVSVWRPVLMGKEPVGMMYLQARHELLDRAFDYLGVLAMVLTGSLVAALLLSNRLQAALTGPLLAISEVARQIRHGESLAARAPIEDDDEIGELAGVFNAMLDELALRAQTLQQANEALQQSDERYQLAVRGSSAGLWDWDMVADTMFYSPRFKALLGYDAQEFPDLPSSLVNIMHADDVPRIRSALRDHIAHDAPYQFECRLRLKSGEWRWFLVTGMAQRNAMGKAFRMAGSVIDVTERKMAEQVLQESNRAKDEFIATLAHELRNPLAPIRTGLEILKKDTANGPASQRARDTMERQLAHMIRLIDDLLDISRINSGKIRLEPGRIRLSGALESAVEISRPAMEARGHELTVRLPAPDIELMGDATRIAQAVGNLLNNAAKYTPPRGHVKLEARQEGGAAVIEVSDDGVGIPPEMLETVFSLFTQVGRTLDRAQGGLGIGLYLVRSLVELHRGTVTAHSDGPGQGSRFTIRIPCLLRAAPVAEPQEPVAAAPAGGMKVLVVDDNEDAAETLATVLEMTGRSTKTVFTGEDVQAAAEAFRPDVVLLDIGLPGISGYQVARQLRADPRFARTVLIAVTGWGSADDRRRSAEAGFDEHLTKPIDLAALEPLLAKLSSAPSA
ncbi:ATP-binding protein [Caenimonas aquaedulcis]|uniref:histidine kinase n=1 Tax=Caenimonas aquaedulcis TaxID=2793270 RepID=A0A931H7B0_9BURK|nr:ATP-binding protein [Caenimonas aquaedulcis]MBG9389863.1 PAS domain-containing protein [Caenimonas aquaedulcis]